MFLKYRIPIFFVLIIVVCVLVVQVVLSQPAPPRPSFNTEGLERLPSADNQLDEPTGLMSEENSTGLDWSRLVYQSYENRNWEIVTSSIAGSDKTQLTVNSANDIHPRLTRGANRIVFASNRTGDYEIYTINPDGTDLTRLTFTGEDNVRPDWSPDNRQIVFQSYRDGQAEIYVMNADGSDQKRLTNDAEYDGQPAWSSDGTKIAFSSKRSGQVYIYVMNADGSSITQLSDQKFSNNPSWSPDGMKIAYDADLDDDGWQELWMMDVNGENQQMLYDPPAQTDAWAHGWSPDSRQIAFTLINFVYYEGNWYWENAYLRGFNRDNPSALGHLGSSGSKAWHPDWQTTDLTPPVTTIDYLPPQSRYSFYFDWSAHDNDSGVSAYEFRYKIGSGGDWIYPPNIRTRFYVTDGVGGDVYFFQARARDNAGNVEPWRSHKVVSTMIENHAPVTSLKTLKNFTSIHDSLVVDWSGTDPGESGILHYNTQYRVDNASWVDWQTVSSGPLVFTDTVPGHTYDFRIQGVDRAQNHEPWKELEGNISTTIYSSLIGGIVQDNSGIPIHRVTVTTTPTSIQSLPSDKKGHYYNYIGSEESTYTASWSKDGYGSLPMTTFSNTIDVELPIILPPIDNIINSPGFELDSFDSAWNAGGSILPVLTETTRHTGQKSAFLGQPIAPFIDGDFLGDGREPQLVVDNQGIAHTVRKYDGNLVYSYRLNDGTWATDHMLSNEESVNVYHLAVDDHNTVHVIWQSIEEGVLYAQRAPNGNWTTPQSVDESVLISGGSFGYLNMAVSNDGIVHVIWVGNAIGANGFSVLYRQRGNDGNWTPKQNISYFDSSLGNLKPQLAVDNEGTVHIIFHANVGRFDDVFYTNYPVDGDWSTPVNVSQQANFDSQWGVMTVSTGGIVHVAWKSGHNDYSLYHARRTPNGTWSIPYKYSELSNIRVSNLFVDDEETLFIVLGNKYVERDKDGIWTDEKYLGHHGNTLASVLDEDGLLHVVFQSTDYEAFYIRQYQFGNWSNPQILRRDPTTNTFFGLRLQVDVHNQAHILWSNAYQNVYYAGPNWTTSADAAELTQQVTIPISMSNPTLSFLYHSGGLSEHHGSVFNIELDSGGQVFPLNAQIVNSGNWNSQSVDLTSWAGQTISISFRLNQAANAPVTWSYLDDVTIGTAQPDVWVSGDSWHSARGEQIIHTLTYGNRGGGIASGVRLTYTLPADLTYISSTIQPISISPLVWDLGHLAAKSDPYTLSMVVQVSDSASPFSTLIGTTFVDTTANELEVHNNQAETYTTISRFIYLPIIKR